MRTLAEHGTNAAYQRHRRRGEPPCPACRQARAAYDLDRYATGARDATYSRARHRAMSRLARLHHDEYADLLAEELRAARSPDQPPHLRTPHAT